MFTSKPRKVTLTLFCYLALVLAVASVAQADVSNHHARDHAGLSRMLKKRADLGSFENLLGASGAASDPPKLDLPLPKVDPAAPPAPEGGSSSASAASASETSASASPSSPSSSSAPASASASASSAAPSASLSASSAASSGSASSASAASSSATPSSSSTEAPPPTPSENSTPDPATDDSSNNNTDTTTHAPSRVTVAITATDGSQPTDLPAKAVGATSTSFPKTALTVIIVIASCIGAVAIGWTVFRKWKLRKSSNFDDRMAPIDWQPSNAADDGIPGLRRNGSSASHGSFQSGGHDDHYSGRGVSAYSESTSGYNAHGTSQLQPIPDHDFTAGPTTLAPVGGYADLARGPSPQPPMSELSRGPSTNRGYDSYGVPLHHQGAYGARY